MGNWKVKEIYFNFVVRFFCFFKTEINIFMDANLRHVFGSMVGSAEGILGTSPLRKSSHSCWEGTSWDVNMALEMKLRFGATWTRANFTAVAGIIFSNDVVPSI